MSKLSNSTVLIEAQQCLEQGRPDAAIHLLRTIPEPAHHRDCCALLAQCYFKRGDARGDVHASVFFAQRAVELGHTHASMIAIIAIGQFRKLNYQDSAVTFSRYVTEAHPAETHYLYGLALFHAQQFADAQHWLQLACAVDPLKEEYSAALQAVRNRLMGFVSDVHPELQQLKKPHLGGVHDRRPLGNPRLINPMPYPGSGAIARRPRICTGWIKTFPAKSNARRAPIFPDI